MPTFASDTFASANGTELSAHNANWKKVSGFSASAQIANGRLRPSNTASPLYYYDVAPGSADYSVAANFHVLTNAQSSMAICARLQSNASTHYRLNHGYATNAMEAGKFVAGTFTLLGNSGSLLPGESANFRLEVIGNSIKVYRDGSTAPQASYTDSSISAAGYAGVRAYSAVSPSDSIGSHIDNFLAATPDAPAPTLSGLTTSHITSSGARHSLTLTY